AARGVTVVLNEGHISDSIIFYSSQFVSNFSPSLLIVSVFFLYIIFTLFITSSSGMAVLTMPIIGGLGMMADIPTREIVNAYLWNGYNEFYEPFRFDATLISNGECRFESLVEVYLPADADT